jgi:hypothetical protein
MPDTRKQRTVTLNADTYARLEAAASAQGESVSAYVTAAAEHRRRRESAQAYAAFVSRPPVAAELAAHREDAHADRSGRDRELLAREADAA